MNFQRIRDLPVLTHIVKSAAFVLLQAAVLYGIHATIPVPLEDSADFTQFDQFLQEELYSYWHEDSKLLETLASPNWTPRPNQILSDVAQAYRQGPDHYLASIKDKDRLLREVPGPRLIFVGGSGLAFGLDSELLAERYDFHPINMGLHMRLGYGFMLRHAGENARPGDVLVLCFEYGAIWEDFGTTEERRVQILEIAPGLTKYFEQPAEEPTHSEAFSAAKDYADDQALADAARKFRSLASGSYEALFPPNAESADVSRQQYLAEFANHREGLLANARRLPRMANHVHSRSGFNQYGDLVLHRGIPRPKRIVASSLIPRLPVAFGPNRTALIESNLRRLNDFARDCEARGVSVLFLYPPVVDSPTAERFAACYASITKKNLSIPLLNAPDEIIVDSKLLFDTRCHLTWPGTCRRMQNLIIGLDRQLEPRTPLSPAAHVAARDRAVRGTMVATRPTHFTWGER